MSRIAYVNGRYLPHAAAGVHIEDRGYQLGDGVYEVCEVFHGRIVDETRHLDRLDRSLRELRIGWPVARAALSHIIREVVRRNRVREGIVYMQVTRGVARRDHYFPTTPTDPALVVTARSTDRAGAESMAQAGIAATVSAIAVTCSAETRPSAAAAATSGSAVRAWAWPVRRLASRRVSTNASPSRDTVSR